MGGIIMNENIDLTKILEGCPVGTMFYSSIYGDATFHKLLPSLRYPVEVKIYTKSTGFSTIISVTNSGQISDCYNGECIFFPSKDQRDWSKFERFWDKPKVEKFDVNTLQPFDKVLVRTELKGVWNIDLFGYKKDPFAVCLNTAINDCIPYNEETKHLLGTNDDCPEYYRWWEE